MVYVGAIFIILGAVIHFAKAYDLIAGVNTMSKEEKEKMDLEGIGKLFWHVMLTMGILFILLDASSKVLSEPNISYYGMWVIMIPGLAYLIIQSNSDKYKK